MRLAFLLGAPRRTVLTRRQRLARLHPRCRVCGVWVSGPVLACTTHFKEARAA